jgi:hypothetical protein
MDELRDDNFKGTQMTITKTKTNNTMLVHSRQCDHQITNYENKKQNGFNSIRKKKKRKGERPERKTWLSNTHVVLRSNRKKTCI